MKCWVIKSMSPDVQRQCHIDLGEPPADAGHWWAWDEHKIGRFGNCERCGWRPVHTSVHGKGRWYEDKHMFNTMREVISNLGKLADERPANLGSGYIVNRPELMQHVIRCWSPCGCCVTYMSQNASVLTQCDLESSCAVCALLRDEHGRVDHDFESREHDFDWTEAERAIQAFLEAETGEQTLAIVKRGVEDGESTKLAPITESKD